MTNNRQIKFRVWDKFRKKMVKNILTIKFDRDEKPCLIVYTDKKIKGEITEQDKVFTNEFDLLQYTGIKDKKGIEIYDGDIVKKGLYAYEVVWFQHEARFGFNPQEDEEPEIMNKYNIENDFEVIGNIYQNKELLTN